MGRRNLAGNEIIIDRVIERKRRSSFNSASVVGLIGSQTSMKDLEGLRDQIENIISDGVITSYEKQGLQREWASLQNAYTSIAEQFAEDEELATSAAYITLRQKYLDLKAIMDKVFQDMTTDYVGDDIKEISSDFSAVYEQLSVCQSILNSMNSFLRDYAINISGSREALEGSTITAGVFREGVEQQNPEFIDGTNYTWRRVDDPDSFTPKNGKSIVITSDDLPVSPCRFSVTWADAEEQEAALSIIFEITYGTIKEWAWSNALTSEELAGMMPSAWSTDPGDQPSDRKYLWRRESKDNRKTYQYFRETGPEGEKGDKGDAGATGPQGPQGEQGEPGKDGTDGKDGQSPKYYYKYTKTNESDAYKGGVSAILIHGRMVSIHGTTLVVGTSEWYDYVPEGEQYENDFLWTKIVQPDGRVDIIPPPQQGEPARDVRIVSSNDTYQLTTRDIVKDDTPFMFSIKRNYVTDDAVWAVVPDPSTVPSQLVEEDSGNPDVLKLTIKKGSSLPSFSVSVVCGDYSDSIEVKGVSGGVEQPYYFKIYPTNDTDPIPIYNRELGTINWNGADAKLPKESPEGPLVTGDYIIIKTRVIQNASDSEGNIEPIPFCFEEGESIGSAGEWKMLSVDSPAYSEAMGTMLADITALPNMPVTTGAFYGFYRNLAAQYAFFTALSANEGFIESLTSNEAFINLLTVLRLIVGTGTGLANSGFRARIGKFEAAEGNDVDIYDVMFDDRVAFKIDPASGRVFFGQPDNQLSAPATGFMYDPGTQELTSAGRKIVIASDGSLFAEGASIQGNINASTGFFGGQIDCPSFSSLPRSDTDLFVDCPAGAKAQYDMLLDDLEPALSYLKLYKCTHSLEPSIKYVAWDGPLAGHYYFRFYDSAREEIYEIYSHTEWWNTSYESPWASSAFTLTITYGEGDVFILKDIPTEDNGLSSGQVWRDGTNLKIVP